MLHSRVTVLSKKLRNSITLPFEQLAKEAVNDAIAKQRALGLANYFSKKGRIYGRAPNGRFVSLKNNT